MRLETVLTMPAEVVAPRLLGSELIRELDDQQVVVRIVETEAYDQQDAASHSYRGQTPRTAVLFGPAGYAYVYFTYGMHFCMNIVTGPVGHGSAVLIRAVEPVAGLTVLKAHRPNAKTAYQMTNGPAKLCQALVIDSRLNGHNLNELPLRLIVKRPLPAQDIVVGTRIGISKEKDRLWRFSVKDNPFVSRPNTSSFMLH